MKKIVTSGAGAVAAAALALPAVAGAHATVTPLQPQGTALTSARGLYVLRVPNERPTVGTWKIRMLIPAPIQESVAFQKIPGWNVELTRRDTGKQDDEGRPVMATTTVTYTARSRDSEIDPAFYGDFNFRFQNPATPGKLCFPISQYYRKDAQRRAGGERVRWWGNSASDTPASCVDVKANPS